MTGSHGAMAPGTYRNPVYPRSSPDPFVLKHRGAYWCYCTGDWHDGRRFGILRSPDLVHWQEVGGAMAPLPGDHPCYWAPEVSYWRGRFYLYYSVGDEETMAIRVAVADEPAGPFVDSGRALTTEPFAIDPHVFEDDDGARYLFYAVDFLEHTHIGTGTVVDRLLDPFTLAGRPRPVVRARYDWQVYDPRRASKGGVRWHTVEGSFVLKRKGRYYHMFSGGNWQNVTYGVSYATTDDIDRPDEWVQHADGERVLPILRTLPGEVIGPGHNSVVRGPDNQQLFCVYHRWSADSSARLLSIDRLEWAGDRLLVLGPTTAPQPAPIPPMLAGFGAGDRRADEGADVPMGQDWQGALGRWSVRDGAAVQGLPNGPGDLRRDLPAANVTLEVSARLLPAAGAEPARRAFGLSLGAHFTLLISDGQALVRTRAGEEQIALPADFRPEADHLIRLEVNERRLTATVDGALPRRQVRLAGRPASVHLLTREASAAFAGFALTVGSADLFEEDTRDLADLGWERAGGAWRVLAGELRQEDATADRATVAKGTPLDAYELVVNARLGGTAGAGGYGFSPAWRPEGAEPPLRLARAGAAWALVADDGPRGAVAFPLPAAFDPLTQQQFRFRKQGGRLTVQWEAEMLGDMAVADRPAGVALHAHRASVAFDMVRLTAIPAGTPPVTRA